MQSAAGEDGGFIELVRIGACTVAIMAIDCWPLQCTSVVLPVTTTSTPYSLCSKINVIFLFLEIVFDRSSYSTFFYKYYHFTNDILIIFYLFYNLHKKI